MYGQDILYGISKVLFEIPCKMYHLYIEINLVWQEMKN